MERQRAKSVTCPARNFVLSGWNSGRTPALTLTGEVFEGHDKKKWDNVRVKDLLSNAHHENVCSVQGHSSIER